MKKLIVAAALASLSVSLTACTAVYEEPVIHKVKHTDKIVIKKHKHGKKVKVIKTKHGHHHKKVKKVVKY